MGTIEEAETTTVFVGDDRYEVAPSWTVGEFKRRVGESDGDVHVRGRDREFVLPDDVVLAEYAEDGAQVTIVSVLWPAEAM